MNMECTIATILWIHSPWSLKFEEMNIFAIFEWVKLIIQREKKLRIPREWNG